MDKTKLHKSELLSHLLQKRISNIIDLWGEAKSFYRDRLIEMGGSYAYPGGDHISVWLEIDDEMIRFKIYLSEVKT